MKHHDYFSIKIIGPTIQDLVGTWIVESNSYAYSCLYASDTEVDCDGNKVSLYGDTVTWVKTGDTGKIVNSGQELYNRINWEIGSVWVKSGNGVMNDSRNLLYYFTFP